MGRALLCRVFILFYVISFTFCDRNLMENPNLFEGDIVGINSYIFRLADSLSDDVFQAALSITATKWPNGTVPYDFESDFNPNSKKKVEAALEYFMRKVNLNGKHCLKFVKRTNENDYVRVIDGSGCYSRIGLKGGRQEISLRTPGCLLRGTIVHEFLHALGVFHEQARPDRDRYVTIIKENIMSQTIYRNNFQKYSTNEVFMDSPYDYGSVMHYEANAFSKNGKPTIIPKKLTLDIGQRVGLSLIDINEIRKFYGCLDDQKIDWKINKSRDFRWAQGCSFRGNTLQKVVAKQKECAQICRQIDKCTHYTYKIPTSRCILKENSVGKEDAVKKDPSVYACGLFLTCTDENKNCQFWANQGECDRIPGFMFEKCCKSCKNK